MDEEIRTTKGAWKAVLVVVAILIILVSGSIGYLYTQYKNEINLINSEPMELYIWDESGELIPIGSPTEVVEEIKEGDGVLNRQGASNPALAFKNKSDPTVIAWYFDHDGKIKAFNLTLDDNIATPGNVTAGTGFITYLGTVASRVTTGFVDTIYSTFMNSTNVSSVYYGNSSDWYTITQLAEDIDTNLSSGGVVSGNVNFTQNVTFHNIVCFNPSCTACRVYNTTVPSQCTEYYLINDSGQFWG